MSNLTLVLNQLEQERNRLTSQLESLNNAISALNGTGSKRTAVARARMAAAQRARWAKVKGRKVVSIVARKRTMSPAARRRIVAAQKARWAKWRKAQKGETERRWRKWTGTRARKGEPMASESDLKDKGRAGILKEYGSDTNG